MKLDSESETNSDDDDAGSMDTVIHRKWVVRTPSPFKTDFKTDWDETED